LFHFRGTLYAARNKGKEPMTTSRVEIFPPGTKIPGESAVEFLSGLTARMSHGERLAQVKWLASLMDDRFAVPGTRSGSAGILSSVCFRDLATC
jgi:hypothetical protein